ncbi:DUF4253 domain-containing protein [Kitasatospora cathayae]|uniref:DUF4253 domain-containing protein n=1 Tax=Kitasatospora cathayae TaxID=3004092 RepID=A0ABY7QF96_9ACTN|nr:DUF4253 domain-containing protein [Kitasatospora sp. HUAS 3-15]WBP91069.1 DUF4253 domain-containing protein [Kitasatospora sp. HUAS 3-15]
MCPDQVHQGTGTLTAYAEQLVDSHHWTFCWDRPPSADSNIIDVQSKSISGRRVHFRRPSTSFRPACAATPGARFPATRVSCVIFVTHIKSLFICLPTVRYTYRRFIASP